MSNLLYDLFRQLTQDQIDIINQPAFPQIREVGESFQGITKLEYVASKLAANLIQPGQLGQLQADRSAEIVDLAAAIVIAAHQRVNNPKPE